MSAVTIQRTVTDEELRMYAEIVYDRTGIRISPQKKTLLSNRLRRRMRKLGIDSYQEYYELLLKLGIRDPEWDLFLQEITTHETYLFRDPGQWDWFSNEYLPELNAARKRGDRRATLRIWSAACSTGDEVYTIACCVAAKLPAHSEWEIEIVGTDIGIGAVEEAQAARFGTRAMQHVPDAYRRRFFRQIDPETWEASPLLKSWTQFRQHNLMKPMAGRPFDVIFVKNVLIYFDPKSKQVVVDNIDRSLARGGMLVTGPAEGVSDLLKSYERVQPWLHRKPHTSKLRGR